MYIQGDSLLSFVASHFIVKALYSLVCTVFIADSDFFQIKMSSPKKQLHGSNENFAVKLLCKVFK